MYSSAPSRLLYLRANSISAREREACRPHPILTGLRGLQGEILLGSVLRPTTGGAVLLVLLGTMGDVCASAPQPPTESIIYKWLPYHKVGLCAVLCEYYGKSVW